MSPLHSSTENLAAAVNASDPSAWRYVAEGSANLVVAYKPAARRPCNPLLQHKSIRLRKCALKAKAESTHKQEEPVGNGGEISSTLEDIGNTTQPEEISFSDFQTEIVNLLFDPAHLVHFQSIELDSEWLAALIDMIELTRPATKRLQECVDRNAAHGLVMDDLTSGAVDGPTEELIAIEIKPKWSFLPQTTAFLDPNTSHLKSTFCRTCVFRAVRSVTSKPANDPASCPIDGLPQPQTGPGQLNRYYVSSDRFCALQLFDHPNPDSLLHGLQKLHYEWRCTSQSAPGDLVADHERFREMRPSQVHNNLKVFRHATVVDASTIELDGHLIDVLAASLSQSRILAHLDHLQRRLDPLDIEGISMLLSSESDPDKLASILTTPIRLSELRDLVPLLSDEIPWLEYKKLFDLLETRQKVVMYILSMTVKDCSIFVRLPACNSPSQDLQEPLLPGQSRLVPSISSAKKVEIKVIDLDLKPLKRLEKYIAKDQETYREFKCLVEQFGVGLTSSSDHSFVSCLEL